MDFKVFKEWALFSTIIFIISGLYFYLFSPITIEVTFHQQPQIEGLSNIENNNLSHNFIQVFYQKLDQRYAERKSNLKRIRPDQLSYRLSISNYKWLDSLMRYRKIRIDPIGEPGIIFLKRIVIKQDGFLPVFLDSKNKFNRLHPKNDIAKVDHTPDGLKIIASGRDPQLEMRLDKENVHFDYPFMAKWLLASLLGGPILYFLLKTLPGQNNFRYVPYLLALVFIAIFYTSTVTRLIHLDEVVHVRAGMYYHNHWLPPEICAPETRSTYSVFGVSRLDNLEIVYLFAGKISKLISFVTDKIPTFQQYRYFNCLLFLILILLSIKYVEFRYLTLPLLITPQVWYLYTYFNSDAFSLFVIIIITYQVMAENSMMNRYLNSNMAHANKPITVFMLGLLFSILLLIKLNYYVFIVFLLLVLVKKLICNEFVDPSRVLKRVGVLVIISATLFGVRWGIDVSINGINRNEKRLQCGIKTARPEFNPNTPLNKKYPFLKMKERNISINSLFEKHNWGWKTFIHSFGSYFKGQNAARGYYKFIMVIVLLFMSYITGSILKQHRLDHILLLMIVGFCSVLLIALSLWNSWTASFQAQGRYLFPILVMVAYLLFETRAIYDRKLINLITLVLFCFSAYSYLFIGLMQFPKA